MGQGGDGSTQAAFLVCSAVLLLAECLKERSCTARQAATADGLIRGEGPSSYTVYLDT